MSAPVHITVRRSIHDADRRRRAQRDFPRADRDRPARSGAVHRYVLPHVHEIRPPAVETRDPAW